MRESSYLDYVPRNNLSSSEILKLINRSLETINCHIQSHNERTAFIALTVSNELGINISREELYYLSMFHTIGFYRFNLNFNGEDFFAHEFHDNYLYGYYYLKYMTPLSDKAEVIRFFDGGFENLDENLRLYAELVFGAGKIACEVFIHNRNPDEIIKSTTRIFSSRFLEAFQKANKDNYILNSIRDSSFKNTLNEYINQLTLSEQDTIIMLKFLIYLMDFKSTYTVTHIINTACYATTLSRRLKQDHKESDMIFASALLHDIGKLAIPGEILESQKIFTEKEREIMRTHVDFSRKIIGDIVDEEICETACRHHEKLNGSGYPQGLHGEDLSESQRLLAVADINSALNDKRSYKEEWDKDRVFAIFNDMLKKGELDDKITNLLLENFDDIRTDLPLLQKLMYADFASVMKDFQEEIYRNYIYDLDADVDVEELEDILDDGEELEEL